jgi:hypothetical protein
MLRKLVPAVVCAVLGTGVTLAIAHTGFSDGPLAGFTGAPAVNGLPEEAVCTACHLREDPKTFLPLNLNAGDGAVRILDLPFGYNPGMTYTFRVQLESDSTVRFPDRRWGFEMTAVSLTTGDGVGTWGTPDPNLLRIRNADAFDPWPNRSYIMHREAGLQQGVAGPVEWTVQWTAPLAASGPVAFFVAGNAASGDGSPDGDDWIHTASDTMQDSTTTVRPSSWGQLKERYRR